MTLSVLPHVAEIKRLFVRPEYRRNKIAEQLMFELEKYAHRKGYRQLILETGEMLTEATSLYSKFKYRLIENYGPYVDMPESVCMGKQILP